MSDREASEKNRETEPDWNRENPYRDAEGMENTGAVPDRKPEEEENTEEVLERTGSGRQETESRGKAAFWKTAVNAAVIVLNGFVIALIVCLILAQPEHGEKVKPSIQKFSVNSDQYYSEHETYQQIHANVHIFESDGRPD